MMIVIYKSDLSVNPNEVSIKNNNLKVLMDIFDRKKQGGVFGTCYAHKNIHYHDPKGSVFYIPN